MITSAFLHLLLQTSAQNTDLLLKEGRMYSVLAVLLVIFLALIAYLIVTERRIRAVERKLQD